MISRFKTMALLCCPAATTKTPASSSYGGPPSLAAVTKLSSGCCFWAARGPGNHPAASCRGRLPGWCYMTTTSCSQSWQSPASPQSIVSWNGAPASFRPEVDSCFRSDAETDRCSTTFRSRPGKESTRLPGCCFRKPSSAVVDSHP